MKQKAKKRSVPKKEKKKTTNIQGLIDFMEDIEKEKVNLDNNAKTEEDIEEKEYSEEILQINKDDIDEISNQNESNEIIILEGLEYEKKELKEEKLENNNSEAESIIENIENTPDKKEKELNLQNNINKPENRKNENQDSKSYNKYDNPPNKFFNINMAKIINKQEILTSSNKQIDNKKKIVYSLQWLGKKFFRMTKKKDLDKVNNIYYYCKNHRTLKNSSEINSKEKRKEYLFVVPE